MSSSKGLFNTGFSFVRVAENNRESMITASVLLYVAFYLVAGIGGISFNAQPVLGYLSTTSNSNCPAGSMWIEGNALHWCDGSTEYYTVDETGDPIETNGAVGGPNGAIWIEGAAFHWIDSGGDEYYYNGQDTGNNPSGASSGDVWIEGGYVHYIDASGNERTIDW